MKSLFELPEMDMSKMMSAFQMPQLNVEHMMAGQQKNMEAFQVSGQLMVEGLQAIAQRQTEMFQKMITDLVSSAAPAAKTDGAEAPGMEALRTMIANGQELQKMAEKLQGAAMAPIFKRVKESMAEQKAAKR
jgi:hypothetical protein